jgi:hypothetical protein
MPFDGQINRAAQAAIILGTMHDNFANGTVPWIQGQFHDPKTGGACLWGALELASQGHGGPMRTEAPRYLLCAINATKPRIIPHWLFARMVVCGYNEDQGRTRADILNVLTRAKVLAEREAAQALEVQHAV